MTAAEASEFLPDGHWLSELVQRAEVFRRHMPRELRELHWSGGFETH